MRRHGLWTLSVALLLVSVGCRDAVDPDAEFTITGEVLDEDGLPVANAEVAIYKVDYFDAGIWRDSAFLHSPSLADQPGLTGVWSTRSDSNGAFEFTRFGKDFNTAGGGRAAWLSTVFVDPDDPDGMRATASNWFVFDDDDPACTSGDVDGPSCHDVGELTLWKESGLSASQSGPDISVNWGSIGSPTGYAADNYRPTFVFMYESTMYWGAYSDGSGVTVPRSAFANDGATQPGFFVVGYSEEISGSRKYMHRTGWQDGMINGYTTVNYGDYFASGGSAFLLDDAGIEIATDGYFDPGSVVPISGQPTELYIDLGSVVPIKEILLYSLGVENLNDASIDIEISSEPGDSAPAMGWTLKQSISPPDGFENWIYASWSGSDSARWIRISAHLVGTGQMPYFTFIDEVSVLD